MLKVLGEEYFIDFREIEELISIKQSSGDTEEQNVSIVKFELIKTMLDVILTESSELDEKMGAKASNDLTIPFKIAFNTLIMYNILKSF